jgi:hypothetical protein
MQEKYAARQMARTVDQKPAQDRRTDESADRSPAELLALPRIAIKLKALG